VSKQVDHLGVPPIDLAVSGAGNARLRVELDIPRSSGSLDNIPFLEVTRNEQAVLLNGVRQDILARLSQSGFTIGDVTYEANTQHAQHGAGAASGNVPRLDKVSFEISSDEIRSDTQIQGVVAATLRNNPDLEGAIREAERNFDARRQDIYETRAREWHRNGGTTLDSNGERYTVTPEAARTYINERHPHSPFERAGSHTDAAVARAAQPLVPGNDQVNRQFEQALRGTNGNRDAAAVAVDFISKAAGYRPDQDIGIAQGKNGLIVSQGQGDTALNLAVPSAQPGDFQRISQQLSQATQQNENV
jgi:hypothetical protein